MNTDHNILVQYAAAKEEERLGLYLMHRDLRQAFLQIDLAEASKAASDKKRTAVHQCFDTLHKCCLGWFSRRFRI